MRSIGMALAGAMLLAAMAPAAADAQRWGGPADRGQGYGRGYDQGYGQGYGRGGYPPRGYAPRNGNDGRGYYRNARRPRCDRGTSGTSGTIIGAIAGGLLGNSVAGRGDRGAGTIIGAGVGALAGRAVDRDC